jgi:hypothetical protein
MQPTPQDNQLMSKHHVLGFKPQLRLEWRGQDGQPTFDQMVTAVDQIRPTAPPAPSRESGFVRRHLTDVGVSRRSALRQKRSVTNVRLVNSEFVNRYHNALAIVRRGGRAAEEPLCLLVTSAKIVQDLGIRD